MDFRLLGPLEVLTDQGVAEVGTSKRAALLTYLLINANEVVSAERLIDELWGEHPPATAAKSVQVYVSQLRKALNGNGSLLMTRGSGYVLAVDDQELDIKRFERAESEAERALEAGDAKQAARLAAEALALWRGPALYDVAYESFAQTEAARLEELRTSALETRIEAELVLGKHAQLVGELEALVAEHPSRERFRAQLMVALYRSGRQSEALAVYRDGTRLLMDDFGLEPSPELRELEQKILTHDGELDAPRMLRPRARRRDLDAVRRASRGGLLLAAGGTLLALVAVLALVESLNGGGSKQLGNTIAMLDPASGDVIKALPVGRTPIAVNVGAGSLWALAADDQTITQIDPRSKHADTFSIGATPTAVAAGAGALWVATGQEQPDEAGIGTSDLLQLDPVLHSVARRIHLPGGGVQDLQHAPGQLAVAGRMVWVVTKDGLLVRVDPRLAQARAVPSLRVRAMAPTGRAVWGINPEGTSIVEVDARTARVRRRLQLHAGALDAIAVGAGAVWVTDSFDGTLWRINPGGKLTTSTIDVGEGADGVAASRDAIWVTNSTHGTLTRVDPANDRVTKVISLGDTPRAVATGAGAVWVAVAGEDKPLEAAASAYAGGPPALPGCGKVMTGADGRYDRVIASDFPLQSTFAMPLTAAHAVLYVLRQHHFRAGRFRIGYQSCNTATPESSQSDMKKCAANARVYAATSAVVGVVGPWESNCASVELPVLNRASVPVVAPYTTMTGLTQVDPTLPQTALKHLYPTGLRNFVRVIGTNRGQAAADMLLVRRLGLRHAYLLYDDTNYGLSMAALLRAAARASGVELAGTARWDRDGRGFSALARRVRAARADGVILSGVSASNGPSLVEALRSGGRRRLALIGTDAFAPTDFIYDESHGAAKGMYSSSIGLWDPQLGASGEHFRREFQPTQVGLHVGAPAAYAAAATDVLLDAIGRSDGTRASVVRALFKTQLADTPIGPVRFDRNGDVVAAPMSILKILGGKGSGYSTGPYWEGARLYRVLRAPVAAVRRSP